MERLDCGDNSCRSPERSRGGMRTNGGCRCNLEDVAQAHERMAAGLRRLPSYAAQVREAQRGYEWACQTRGSARRYRRAVVDFIDTHEDEATIARVGMALGSDPVRWRARSLKAARRARALLARLDQVTP